MRSIASARAGAPSAVPWGPAERHRVGFAGIENELYYEPMTSMLFGDAKTSVADITSELSAL